jgi:Icc-related predicted phosphoesterase
MKILAISDLEVETIYSPQIAQRFKDVDMVISCGDLPYYYQEYIMSMLNTRLYYVRGNHAPRFVEEGEDYEREEPWGGVDLHRKVTRDPSGLLLAGIEGSLKYNKGSYQYTQPEMWMIAFSMVPQLMLNRARFGRYLDILVTHAPPRGIHDKEDLPHQGIKAFRWLIRVFKPVYALHGHIHVYRQYETTETTYCSTRVINTYGYKLIPFDLPRVKPG